VGEIRYARASCLRVSAPANTLGTFSTVNLASHSDEFSGGLKHKDGVRHLQIANPGVEINIEDAPPASCFGCECRADSPADAIKLIGDNLLLLLAGLVLVLARRTITAP